MDNIQSALDSVVSQLSDENYDQSFAFYRCWFDIGQTYHQVPSDLVFNIRKMTSDCFQSFYLSQLIRTSWESTHPYFFYEIVI